MRQTPSLVGCLFCFQLYPFVVVKVNILIDQLSGFFKSWCFELAEIFFFEMTEEVFHRGVVPTVGTPRHGRRDVILLGKDIMIRLRSVLVPLVTVEDQSISDLLCLLGL